MRRDFFFREIFLFKLINFHFYYFARTWGTQVLVIKLFIRHSMYANISEKRRHIKDRLGNIEEEKLFQNLLDQLNRKTSFAPDQINNALTDGLGFTTIYTKLFEQEYLDKAYQQTSSDAINLETNMKQQIKDEMVWIFIA